MENPIQMDDLGVPLSSETPIWISMTQTWIIFANDFFWFFEDIHTSHIFETSAKCCISVLIWKNICYIQQCLSISYGLLYNS